LFASGFFGFPFTKPQNDSLATRVEAVKRWELSESFDTRPPSLCRPTAMPGNKIPTEITRVGGEVWRGGERRVENARAIPAHLEFLSACLPVRVFYLSTCLRLEDSFCPRVFLYNILARPFTRLFLYRKSLDHVIESNRTAGLVEAVNRRVVEAHAHINGTTLDVSTKPETEGKLAPWRETKK
jgi:hypothetical protein